VNDDFIKFKNLSTSKVGVSSIKTIINEDDYHIHLNEWWNGEGADLSISHKDKDIYFISLPFEVFIAIKELINDFYE